MRFSLSKEDVAKLLNDPSAATRADVAQKVGREFSELKLSDSERALAEEIIRAMMRDAEVRVRRALAESVKKNSDLPHDVALKLANDTSEVATPIIEFSEVLGDEDLIEIVRTRPEGSQMAVARRNSVSSTVADALVDTKSESVVAELVTNDGAEISETTYQKVLNEFSESERIKTPMVGRKALPISVAERLVTLVSDSLRDQLVTRHELSPDVASDLVLDSRERAIVGMLSSDTDESDVGKLVGQLNANGRLTPTIMLRALCMGDIAFFEESLAAKAGISAGNARVLIYDQGALGLDALFGKSELPAEILPVVRVAVEVARELDYDGRPGDRERFRQRMIERVLTHFEAGFDGANLEYLVAKLGQEAHV